LPIKGDTKIQVIILDAKQFDIKALAPALNAKRLCFGPLDRLNEHLGVGFASGD